MEKNPFAILGFAPSAFKGLTDEQIFKLVKALHHSQMMLRHQDVGGSATENKTFNEAWAEINLERNPSMFAYWKEQFVAPRKNKLEGLYSEIEKAAESKKRLEESLLRFWESLAEKEDRRTLSAVHPRPARILVMNSGEAVVVNRLFSKPQFRMPEGYTQGYDICMGRDGSLVIRDVKHKKLDQQTETLNLPLGWIGGVNKQFPKGSYFWEPQKESALDTNLRLIGGIPVDALRAFEEYGAENSNLSSLKALLPPAEDKENLERLRGGFPLEQLRPYLEFMTPVISAHSFLLAVNRKTPGYIMLLGRVQAVHIL